MTTKLKESDFITLKSEKELNDIVNLNHNVYKYGYTIGTLEDLNNDIYENEINDFSYDIIECYKYNNTYVFFND